MTGDPLKQIAAALERAESLIGEAIGVLADAQGVAFRAGFDLDQRLPASAFDCATPVTEHRKNHRPGRPSKIDSDPELAAFICARIDRLTFFEIADEVTRHFPEERRVKKSAIYAWWARQRSRRG